MFKNWFFINKKKNNKKLYKSIKHIWKNAKNNFKLKSNLKQFKNSPKLKKTLKNKSKNGTKPNHPSNFPQTEWFQKKWHNSESPHLSAMNIGYN